MNPNQNNPITCSQKHKTFILYTNGAVFSVIELDKGQDNKSKKCDYLIIKDTKDIQIFIELKGSNIAQAYEQILTSRKNRESIQDLQIKYYAAIICSRYPQIDSTIQRMQRKAKKLFEKVFVKSGELKTQYDIKSREITDKLAGMAK